MWDVWHVVMHIVVYIDIKRPALATLRTMYVHFAQSIEAHVTLCIAMKLEWSIIMLATGMSYHFSGGFMIEKW